MHFNSMAVH